MRLIDADVILCDGFNEWLACVLCGRATKERPSCDGACDMQARLYADKVADALAIWLAEVPTIDAEPVRHGHWERKHQKKEFPGMHILINGTYPTCSVCGFAEMGISQETDYCPNCGAKMDEVSE